MKPKLLSAMALLLIAAALCSCSLQSAPGDPDMSDDESTKELPTGIWVYGDSKPFSASWYTKTAREVTADGYVYSFIRSGMKDGNDDGIIKYQFGVRNIRYNYSSQYIYSEKMTANDYAQVNKIISNEKTDEELLALDPADFKFEKLDGEIFFRLMRTALEREEWDKENPKFSYWELPIIVGIMTERGYTDGYKFQVSSVCGAGCIDEMFIDVRYQTGSGFEQLSDLIDAGRATGKQKELFDMLRGITEAVKEEESYIALADAYKDIDIGGVDLGRLYDLLYDIHSGKGYELVDDERMSEPEVSLTNKG